MSEQPQSDAHLPATDGGDQATRKRRVAQPLLFEIAWEVCQQVGGIYTVLRSKAGEMDKAWGERYCLLGPYMPKLSPSEFEEVPLRGLAGRAVAALQSLGVEVHTGYWLITGRPRVVLINPQSILGRLGEIKYLAWEHHGIALPAKDDLIDPVVAFGWGVEQFFRALAAQGTAVPPVVAHFHEWMAGTAIPELRRAQLPFATVFTTHATMLGRYLAPNDPWMYDHAPFVDWEADARRMNIEPQVRLERAAAHGAHVFTTVSDVTAFECQTLLGRPCDVILPNGLNIERYAALHEFQNMHRVYKERIHRFVMGHFWPSYTFDLDKTLYFFTSGRFEYRNKGFDLTIESLARLNARMKEAKIDRTVVFFLVTKQPFRQINAEALRNRMVMDEIRSTCETAKEQIGDRLFTATAKGQWPHLEDLIDDHWRLRLRRMRHAWHTERLPTIVTHDLYEDGADPVLAQLRHLNLINLPSDPVKVVYHPDFISPTNPFFGMEYDQFVRGCHLGVFPSAYEPWGYTPLESIARGIPAVTSDLSGFGTYLMKHMPQYQDNGMLVVHRRYTSWDYAAAELTDWLFDFVKMEQRERINLRNRVEACATQFDWEHLALPYHEAHNLALARAGLAPE